MLSDEAAGAANLEQSHPIEWDRPGEPTSARHSQLDAAELVHGDLIGEGPVAPGANLDISVEALDGHLRVTPTGEVDLSTVEQLEHQILQVLGNRSACLVLDLSQLEFMDAAGIRVLAACHDRATNSKVAFQVIVGHGEPRRILELGGLLERRDVVSAGR